MQIILGLLTMEIFSFVLWLHIFYLVIGIVVFVLFGLLADKFKLPSKTRFILYALFILLTINGIPFFEEGQILTLELIKGLVEHSEQRDVGIIIHSTALLSFTITYLIHFRKSKHCKTSKV